MQAETVYLPLNCPLQPQITAARQIILHISRIPQRQVALQCRRETLIRRHCTQHLWLRPLSRHFHHPEGHLPRLRLLPLHPPIPRVSDVNLVEHAVKASTRDRTRLTLLPLCPLRSMTMQTTFVAEFCFNPHLHRQTQLRHQTFSMDQRLLMADTTGLPHYQTIHLPTRLPQVFS